MVRNRAAREVPFGRDPTKPTGQAEMAENNLASYRTSAEAELSSLQTGWVEVKFGEKPILVSRRTFSEVVRSKLLTIVYNEKFDETTAPDDNQENNQNQTKKIVLVSFHPTTKTYEILIFQSPNGTTTTSPTKIDPLTEEGQAWIRCLHLAYSYYNFQQAKIQTEYEHLVDLVQDPSELIGTEQPDRHLRNPDSEDLLLSLPKVVDRWKDKILPFDSNSTILLKYLRIGPTGLENPEEPASRCPGLSWFDPYTYTYYTLLFRPDSKEYVLTYRYRKEQFLYIVTIKIEKINANTKQVKFSKQVTKQTQNLKPKSSSKNHTSSSRKAKKAKPQPDNPLPQAVSKPPVATSTVTPQTINPAPKENFSDLNSPNQTSTNVTEEVGKAGGHKVTLEVVESVSIEGRYPDLIQSLIPLINLLHCAFPDYDFSLGKVKDKK